MWILAFQESDDSDLNSGLLLNQEGLTHLQILTFSKATHEDRLQIMHWIFGEE